MSFAPALHLRTKHVRPLCFALVILVAALVALDAAGLLSLSAARTSANRVESVGETSANAKAGSATKNPALLRRDESFGKLPLRFEENRGQRDARVKFVARGNGYQLGLTPTGAVLSLARKDAAKVAAADAAVITNAQQRGDASDATTQTTPTGSASPRRAARAKAAPYASLEMKLLGARAPRALKPEQEFEGKANYFVGNDPSRWRTGVQTYARVRYEEVYPGIDLLFYGGQRQLEYDFLVAPGADPRRIKLAFEGAEKISVDAAGDLVLAFAGGVLRQSKPIIYQEVAGARREIEGGYALEGKNGVGFRVGKYDPALPLVIDPILVYSTYLDFASTSPNGGITIDAAGNVFLTGSLDDKVYVAKLNSQGTDFVYTTTVGGTGTWGDLGTGIAIDSAGNAYVTGLAHSLDFPTVNAFQPQKSSQSINVSDAFLFKLDSSGSALAYSTFLGGENADDGNAVAVDAQGNAFVAGYTESPIQYVNAPPGAPFPTVNAFQPLLGGQYDAFLAKFGPSGQCLFSTYLGGQYGDMALDVAVDADGAPYVVGGTSSPDYPTAAPLQAALAGGGDAFVTKFNPAGSGLIYSTFLGGEGNDTAMGLALDSSKNVYLTGYTYSQFYPTLTPFQSARSGLTDAFVTKINGAGSALVYSTLLGGAKGEQGSDITINAAGEAYVAGSTSSIDFPVVNPVQPTLAGAPDAFIAKFNAAGNGLGFSTYLGGNANSFADYGSGVAVDAAGGAYLYGLTYADNFPLVNPLVSTNTRGDSAFLAKFNESGAQTLRRISGRIESNNGNQLYGATVTLSGSASATVQTNGSYFSFNGLPEGGTYTVTPTLNSLAFDPPSQTFANLSADATADFMQAPRTYQIEGRVTDPAGAPVPNVVVSLGGLSYSFDRYTDSLGNYKFSYLEAGRNYTVTPAHAQFSFAPRSVSFPDTRANKVANFSALSNAGMSVAITAPSAGAAFQAPAMIGLAADAAGTSGGAITSVEFFANGNSVGIDTTAPYQFDWANVAGGTYTIKALATNAGGAAKESAPLQLLVNSVGGPVVNLTNPVDNAILLSGQYITLAANASSPNGAITKVDFYEGSRLLGGDAASPYTFSYYLYEGSYTLTAVAYDGTGALTRSAPVRITGRNNSAPTAFLPNPEGGPFYPAGANITLAATASDSDGTVSQVQFYANSTLLGTDTNTPYGITWNNAPTGSYTLVAKATDNEGGYAYSNYRDIRVGNSPPTASLQSPASSAQYAAPASIPMTASAFDADGQITQVEFIAGGNVVGIDTTAPYSFTWNNVPAGDYHVAVRATDDAGATGLSFFTLVRVFASLPQVSITRPATGANFVAPASIVLEANATSPVGITSVWYYANGQNIGITHTAPYRMTWAGVLGGTHTITAEAHDGNSAVGTSAPVTVTVSGASWELQAPRVSGLNTETINDVSMVSATEGWAAGEGGLIVHTTDGGLNWMRQTSGTTDPLNAIHFEDAQHGWAAGNDMIYTQDGGRTWQQSNWSLDTVYGITCADLNICYASRGGTYLHKTTDGGRNWFIINLPFDVGLPQFFDARNGVASGEGGVLRTTDAGQTWTTWARTHGGYFINFNEGWSVSGSSAERTIDGGLTWQPQTLPAGSWIYGFRMFDAQNGIGVGSQENIVRTTDGGATWTTQRAPSSIYPLWSVSYGDLAHIVAVGNSGTVLSSADGGLTWTRSPKTQNPKQVNRVTATDVNHAWSANADGEVMYTSNGGATWSFVSLAPPVAAADVVGIEFSDNSNGWAALRDGTTGPSYVYRSADGGQSWQRSASAPSTDHLYDVAALNAQTAVVVGSGSDFWGKIRRTTDGGQTWTAATLPASTRQLYAVDFINETTGWAAGFSNTMLKTTDGGQTWTRQTVTADYLYDVSFSDANNGWAVGEYYMAHTTDGGQTWQMGDTNGQIRLQGVHTVNATTAWIVGEDYVGRTTNGGATWTGESLGDYRFSRSVYFVDADNGWVVSNGSSGAIYRRKGAANPNAPQIQITEPANGATFPANSSLTIRAAATSPVGTPIATVDFYVNNQLWGTDTTAPFERTWNNLSANVYVLTAIVTDTAGAQGHSQAVSVTYQLPVEPTVFITTPANGATFTAGANINIAASAQPANSSRFISRVEFYEGANLIGTDTGAPYGVTWPNVTAGNYTLRAKAFDNLGAQAQSEPVAVSIGGTPADNPPLITITGPAAGASFNALADITISADASDPGGAVAKVDFFAGANFIGTDTTAPYGFQWSGVAAGTYSLTARATDSGGAATVSNSVTVTVNAQPPPPTPTPTPLPTGPAIAGRVTSPIGTPQANITITLAGSAAAVRLTDGHGNFLFDGLSAGGNYTVTPSADDLGSFIFNPEQCTVANLQALVRCDIVGKNLNGDEGLLRPVLISEFRFSGPGGATDEFIELYNNTDRAVVVQTADGSAGWALVANDGLVRFVVPNGTVIPARGHFLAAHATGFSLRASAEPDLNYPLEISNSAGVALFQTAEPANFIPAFRFDAFGYNAVTEPLYREGLSTSLVSEGRASEDYSYARKQGTGAVQDTDENGADFQLLSAGGVLGSPGPDNLASPVQRNANIKSSLIDPFKASTGAPNRVRVLTPIVNGAAGTLSVRRKFTNNTRSLVTRLRFRVVDITTLGSPNTCGGCAQADLRAVNSTNLSVTTTTGLAFVRGTLLNVPAPLGGGLNTALEVPLPGGGLAPGASVNVQFLLGVERAGAFRFFITVEALQ